MREIIANTPTKRAFFLAGILRPGTVGTTFYGVNNTILNADAFGHGELATSSRNVFMGYLWDEARTRAAFTEDHQWYRSGDIAKSVSRAYTPSHLDLDIKSLKLEF